ncbi:MAG: citramalate synthase [Chitinispirillales bacterium]|jgi:2-isopropylmalate synthase|nr:citramalate synthase [Chitinispirillales bacterium]
MSKNLTIYDTTLRDGNQTAGVGLSLRDKLKIAEKLDDFGVDYIEGGWPNSTNQIDTAFYREIKKLNLKNSKIAAFGSTKRPRTNIDEDGFIGDLVAADTGIVTIYGKSWKLHVTEIIRCTPQENLDMIAESVEYLLQYKDEVIFDAEHFFDGYKDDAEYAVKVLETAKNAGAKYLVLCDTNGGILPEQFSRIFKSVSQKIDGNLGVHFHNDSGCAEANSILSVEFGAVQIQGTINGMGERCGNANLCTIIPAVQMKLGKNLIPAENMKKLKDISISVSEIANMGHNANAPFVGDNAFSHKAGAHADGVRKNSVSFEHISPETVGNSRNFVVSDQAGRGTILEILKGILHKNVEKDEPIVNAVLKKVKEMEAKGYHFEMAQGTLELLIHKEMSDFVAPFETKAFRVIEDKSENGESVSEAIIKIFNKETREEVHTAANGDGPVDALYNALIKAVGELYPSIAKVHLKDFKVRVLEGSEGTAASVRVLIESSDGVNSWGTIGVSTNIIEASWDALLDSVYYKLLKG